MDIFDEELLNFRRSLDKYDVKYIMVGGFAVNLHGFSRLTGDLDIWLKDIVTSMLGLEGISFEKR